MVDRVDAAVQALIQAVSKTGPWREMGRTDDGVFYEGPRNLRVILTVDEEQDGQLWVHLSLAHRGRIPTYPELAEAKQRFLGNRKALQVFAPKEEHVNIHEFCLHLWSCLEDDPLPDFTRGGGSI